MYPALLDFLIRQTLLTHKLCQTSLLGRIKQACQAESLRVDGHGPTFEILAKGNIITQPNPTKSFKKLAPLMFSHLTSMEKLGNKVHWTKLRSFPEKPISGPKKCWPATSQRMIKKRLLVKPPESYHLSKNFFHLLRSSKWKTLWVFYIISWMCQLLALMLP